MRRWLIGMALALVTGACGASQEAEPLELAVFDHTGGAALDVTEGPGIVFSPYPDADLRSIEFNNPRGERVTGIVSHPPEGPGEVGVLILPGLPETAAQNLEPLALLSCAGATGLAINPPYVREGRLDAPLLFDEGDRDEQVQFVIESRRAVDVLEESGASAVGVHAVSWGVSIAAMLAGIDDRIDASALMIGHGGVVERFLPDGEPVGPLVGVPDDQREKWVEAMEPLDATLYVGNSTSSFLFQNGRTDPFVSPDSAERLHDAAPPTREIIWYDVGHEVTPTMISDNFGWLGEMLGLDPSRVSGCVAAMPSS